MCKQFANIGESITCQSELFCAAPTIIQIVVNTETGTTDLPPVVSAAHQAIEDIISEVELNNVEVNYHSTNEIREKVLKWTSNGDEPMTRCVTVSYTTDPDGVVDEYPPVLAVELSAWKETTDQTVESVHNGVIADIFDKDAEKLGEVAVRTAFDTAQNVSDDDLWTPDYLNC